MTKIKIGCKYPTVKGVMVTITGLRKFPDFQVFSGDNGMDYDSDGKASFALMFRGRFSSPENDLLIES